jgi:hypothetical protein
MFAAQYSQKTLKNNGLFDDPGWRHRLDWSVFFCSHPRAGDGE